MLSKVELEGVNRVTHKTNRLLALFAIAAGLFTAVSPQRASADDAGVPICVAPNIMITVDKSSSMTALLAGTSTSKWQAAQMGIGELVTGFGDTIDFGLQIFPYPNHCGPGQITVDVGPSTMDPIVSAMMGAPPSGGNYTPLYQTLQVLETYAPLQDSTRENHVVLVTDGWQWCSNADSTTPMHRFDAVTAIQALNELGITVHVIGFGSEVDALMLNRAAVAGGAPRGGCDITSSDPSSTLNCYTQVDNIAELRAAFMGIASSSTMEICDGIDNNCDGTIDEGCGCTEGAMQACGGDGLGACATPGTQVCHAHVWGPCMGQGTTGPEICDGIDNNCDGVVDEGCSCIDGTMRSCTNGPGACSTPGTQTCVSGMWTQCDGSGTATNEICDGIDNDCDGQIDNGFPNLGMSCSAGSGECMGVGTYVCSADHTTTVCNAVPGDHTTEICDGIDNDCDGVIDNGFPNLGMTCTVGIGTCAHHGTFICTTDHSSTTCSAMPGQGTQEICDGLDNDCDGEIDNGTLPGVGAMCTGGTMQNGSVVCVPGMTICEHGMLVCFGEIDGTMGNDGDLSSNTCNMCPSTDPNVHPGAVEICNGVDDNCDGIVDNGATCPIIGEICIYGRCESPDAGVPDAGTGPGTGGLAGGAGCAVGHQGNTRSNAGFFMLIALAVVVLRRKKW